jgi:hypothetical protein
MSRSGHHRNAHSGQSVAGITRFAARHDITDQRDAAESTDPVLAHDPMDTIDTVKPTEPIERTEPSEQIDSVEFLDLYDHRDQSFDDIASA